MTIMRDARDNMRWEDPREKVRAHRESTDEQVEALLDGGALEDYQE